MFVLDNILIGPFRILLLFSGVLFVHQLITRQALKTYDLNYVVKRSVFFSSVSVLLVFALIQLNMYNIFSILVLVLLVILVLYLDINKFDKIQKRISVKRRKFLLLFFRFMERKTSLKKLINNNFKFFDVNKINMVLLLAFILATTTFISRYSFFKNDLYTLSSLWIKNLEVIKSLNSNVWFSSNVNLMGELAFINFYSKVTGISQEMAMYSFGLLENFALGVILYWFVKRITYDKYIAPLVSVLFFAFFYKYLPININLLLEHKSLYLGLCLALPAILFTTKSKLLRRNKSKYFMMLYFIYAAIGLINLFVLLVILPIFLVVSLLLFTNITLPYIGRSILAYVLGTATSLGVNWLGCYANSRSFLEFLKAAMIQVDSYTYFPQLFTPLEQLTQIYLIITASTALLISPLFIRHRKKWTSAMVILISILFFISMKYLNLSWIDIDLYYKSLSVLIVTVFGIVIGAVVTYLNISMPRKSFYKIPVLSLLFSVVVATAYWTNDFFKYDSKRIDELKESVLNIYDNLSENNMPYSYSIVNQNYGQSLSKNEHHFINYNNFINEYPKRDSVYQLKKDDKPFLQMNPDFILPESVFVFITKIGSSERQNMLETPTKVSIDMLKRLDVLKDKGREISIFYEDDFILVYEIVNKKESSNLNDLIFNL